MLQIALIFPVSPIVRPLLGAWHVQKIAIVHLLLLHIVSVMLAQLVHQILFAVQKSRQQRLFVQVQALVMDAVAILIVLVRLHIA